MNADDNENTIVGLPVRSEEIGFKPDEMTACPACGRTNPPNRLNCFYCSAVFDADIVDASKVKLAARRLENWEPGINVIAMSGPGEIAESLIVEVARNTGIEADAIRAACAGTSLLPLSRVESDAESAIISANLSRIGIATLVVADANLAVDKPPVRCRSIAFGDEQVTLTPFNSANAIEVDRESIRLIVSGTLYESKVEATEKRKSRKSTIEIESESSSDTPVIDIYHDGDTTGFRIPANGFDFSCLGAEKEYVASKNIVRLLERIVSFAPDAKFVADYNDRRRLLDAVWEVDERSDSLGIRRSGLGKTNIANVTTRSNLSQFIKYSRMHRHLL